MLAKSIIAAMLFFSVEKPAVTVLCYHSFAGDKNMYSFSIEELREQIDYFRMRGYSFVSYSDFASGRVKGRKNIMVTIDDGHETVYNAYNQVLKPYGIKPLLGIYPAIIGKKDYALTWERLSELVSSGCEIAGHGYNHLYVNKKLHDKDNKSFNREIYHSKKVLEEKLGITVKAYIYPFGERSPVTIDHMKKAKYQHAFTIVNGLVEVPVAPAGNYEVRRYMLTRPTWKSTIAVIDRKVSGGSKSALSVNEKALADPPAVKSTVIKKKIVKPAGKTVSSPAVPAAKKEIKKKERAAVTKPRPQKTGGELRAPVSAGSRPSGEAGKALKNESAPTLTNTSAAAEPGTAPPLSEEKAPAPVQLTEKDLAATARGIKKMKDSFSEISSASRNQYSEVGSRFRNRSVRAGTGVKNLFDLNREEKQGKK